MRKLNQWIPVVVAVASLMQAGPALAAGDGTPSGKKVRPSKVEAIEGSKLKRVTVTEKAAKRLDIQTVDMVKEGVDQLSVPYAAILYDIGGGTWVYTAQQPLSFVRQSVVVHSIKGVKAVLKEGPVVGTKIVTVGVAELYGTEKGLGH